MSLVFSPLPDVGFIAAEGRDAAAFLHAQLAQDITALGIERAPLAGWHDARGRVRAVFRVWRLPERFVLTAPADAIDGLLRDLTRFVLRAQVRLSAADGWTAAALIGAEPAAAARGLPTGRDEVRAIDGLHVARAAGDLWHAIGSGAAVEALAARLPRCAPQDAAVAAIRAGLPTIGAALSGRFVAQMLNLDALGAISFTKGCYPGQEIVARAHHLGTVKRRMRRFRADSALVAAPGAELTDAGGAAVGELVSAAQSADGTELLAVVANDVRGAPLFLAGAPLEEQPLPYDIP